MGLSPMMQQYLDIKDKNPDTILFFRLGDFYEMFFEDAKLCSRELELTLTGKDCGLEERAPMCGVPFHSSTTYIQKLIEKGYKVAICEQVEDPKEAKGLVKRDVVKIVTPGTLLDTNMLDETKNNYVANIFSIGKEYAFSYADISTGECYVTYIEGLSSIDKIIDDVMRVMPSEFILSKNMLAQKHIVDNITKRINTYISEYIQDEEAENNTLELLKKYKMDITKVEEMSLTVLLTYITETQKSEASQINKIERYSLEKFMRLDNATRKNLEIMESSREKTKKGSLLWVLDKTSTAMGARQMKKWLEKPLLNVKDITTRLDAVEAIKSNVFFRDDLIDSLRNIYDIERIIAKVVSGNINGRDLVSLKNSIKYLPEIRQKLLNIIKYNEGKENTYLLKLYSDIDELQDIYALIDKSINDDVGITIKEGNIIKKGYNKEVDTLRFASTDGKSWLMQLEANEKERTGIKNLKVGYNKVFGYYIEVTKSFISQVPEDRYIRKQTLTGGERYITEELKTIEEKILGSEDKLTDLEYKLFVQIRNEIARSASRVQKSAEIISILDVLCSFAYVAENENYVKPIITDDGVIDIRDGRHPVVEKSLRDVEFIPNNTFMDLDAKRFHVITGPNMAGKSTYMRQVAVITYMAQVGCFVPASYAKIGIVDRIFTRVGASDDLAMGESTFMVEMTELSNILENATSKSLIILDEIGRGTSTYDGLSIAWATVEYIWDKEKIGAKTLFATHYHELTELGDTKEGINNFSVAVKEKGDDVIFLRKIVEGGADESYGIYVAKLAGVPKNVTKRANEILRSLERKSMLTGKTAEKENKKVVEGQVDMFNFKLAEVAHEIDKINLNELTPIDALNTLVKIKEKMK